MNRSYSDIVENVSGNLNRARVVLDRALEELEDNYSEPWQQRVLAARLPETVEVLHLVFDALCRDGKILDALVKCMEKEERKCRTN